jgi:Tol biopolymer transport system component
MRRGRILSMALAGALVLVACSGGSDREQPQDRPSPSTAAADAPGPSGGDRSSSYGRIAFDNFDDVWTIDADGTDLTRLTHSPGPDFDPSWSPDGTQIAFRSERSGEPEIWVMNADGTGQHRLTRGLSPAWSPDGLRIAYASPGDIPCPPGRGLRCTGISIMNADGSGQHRLPNTDGGEYPSWSPDGKRIAFNSNLSGDHLMYIVDVDGSHVVDLSRVGEGWQVDWSPDGRSILFTSHRDHPDNYTDIYVMRPDGSGVKRLTHDRAYTPAWSPDGDSIVFSAPGLFIMDPDGSDVIALDTPGVGETSLPDWTD